MVNVAAGYLLLSWSVESESSDPLGVGNILPLSWQAGKAPECWPLVESSLVFFFLASFLLCIRSVESVRAGHVRACVRVRVFPARSSERITLALRGPSLVGYFRQGLGVFVDGEIEVLN